MSSIIFAKLSPSFFRSRKVRRAGRNGRDAFLATLCMNADRGAHGWIPLADLEAWYLADYLSISEADAEDGVRRAITAGLISVDGDRVDIVGWDEDWSRRPKTEAERAREYRERKVSSRDVRDASREMSRVTDQIEERRGERGPRDAADSLSRDSTAESPPKTRAQTGAAQPLPSAWEPSASAAAYARSHGLDLVEETRRFRLNAAQRGHTFVDADAAFELWISRSRDKRKPPKPGATKRAATTDEVFGASGQDANRKGKS